LPTKCLTVRSVKQSDSLNTIVDRGAIKNRTEKKMNRYWIKKEFFRTENPVFYGDLKEGPTDYPWKDVHELMEVYELPYSTGSDYSGDTVTKCNHDVFLELAKENRWFGVRDCYGGYSTYAIILSKPATENPEIKELINGLEDYPLIDEEAHSEHELELEQENWESWVKSDFLHELQNKLETDKELSDGALFKLFRQACEDSNTYPLFETGEVLYWDFDSIIPAAIDILNSYLPPISQYRREKLNGQLFILE